MDVAISLIVVALAVILSIVATWRVRRSIGLTRSQKTAQAALAWVLPFIGALAVIVMSKEETGREKRSITASDAGADLTSGGGYYGGDGGGHRSHHGHGFGGDAGHGGGGAHGGDGGGGH